MRRPRNGYTLIEMVFAALLLVMLVGVIVLGLRVQKLNTWAVKEQAWSQDVYRWIHNNSFQNELGGDTDPVKPPPPPDDL